MHIDMLAYFWKEALYFTAILSALFAVLIWKDYSAKQRFVLAMLFIAGSYIIFHGLLLCLDFASIATRSIPVFEDLDQYEFTQESWTHIISFYLPVAFVFYALLMITARRFSKCNATERQQNSLS